jgi:hypothetical protein
MKNRQYSQFALLAMANRKHNEHRFRWRSRPQTASSYLRVPPQSFCMAWPGSLLTEWPAEAPWQRSTQKKICGKRFYAALWKVRNTAMQTPTRLFPALISRGLMLFSITDSATRSFSAGRVTPRQPKDAWPRQRVNSWQPSTSPRAFHFFCLFAQVVDVIASDDNSSTPVKIAGSLAYSTPMNLKKLLWTSFRGHVCLAASGNQAHP